MRNQLSTIALALMLGLGTLSLSACENDGPAESAGEEIDETMDSAEDGMEDAGDDMEDAGDEF